MERWTGLAKLENSSGGRRSLHGRASGRFGKELEMEAVRLVETNGRTQIEIAEDLGIGLSSLRRWRDKRRLGLQQSLAWEAVPSALRRAGKCMP